MNNSSGWNEKRKQKTLTLAEKARIIEEYESGGGTHEFLGIKYGVGSSSVTRFIQRKNDIRAKLKQFRENGLSSRRTMKEQSFPFVEESLYVWMLQQQEANNIVLSEVLRTKAELLFHEIQKCGHYVNQRFKFSDGWMRRFKQRFGLQASADMQAYHNFRDILASKIAEMELLKSQVYTAHESSIFIRLLASGSRPLSNENNVCDHGLNKMRYTFMPCSNADGTNKLQLMFIGTEANPRSFPAKEMLPVSYYHSEKAWMTRNLFREWFYNEFVPAVRKFSSECFLDPKALLVLRNCTAHYTGKDDLVSDDGLIKVIYLPPNVTTMCQPMDQGVINAVKARYKRKLMLYLLLENEELKFEDRLKKISLLQSIDWLSSAWIEITPSTIENSWGCLIDQFPICETESDDPTEPDLKALVAAVDSLAGTSTTNEEIELWMSDQVYDVDNNPAWLTSAAFTDQDIVASILRENIAPIKNSLADESTETVFEPLFVSVEELPEEQRDLPEETRDLSEEPRGNPEVPRDPAEEPRDMSEDPTFCDAIKSLDCLLRYVRDDAAEVSRLESLRKKIIDSERLKRAA
ncbi:jerky protein homolog-like isoform X2 [Toxorhynchites rutilus septentrionalis]|uniref:jerky protein homolog-like isoform X2 n=1 Tax=Toxorhynchites rutilus septentrionalis TaxID=329112 RepID=UPI002478A692|nr:jerky protein homolog-like isoform X2 [Toxorhynchites rutilus septentrionalis]